jgi:hypothetical protein
MFERKHLVWLNQVFSYYEELDNPKEILNDFLNYPNLQPVNEQGMIITGAEEQINNKKNPSQHFTVKCWLGEDCLNDFQDRICNAKRFIDLICFRIIDVETFFILMNKPK